MSGNNENIFITGSQIPSTNEETIQSILDIIKNASTFQDVINKLEEDKLIWYFLRHWLKDHEIHDHINSKWKEEFAGFNKSIDSTAKELKGSTENQEFLVYPKSDNSLEMRFIADDSEQISVETSSVLRASPEGKIINISLGGDNIVTATRKIRDKRNERHYDFSNSDSCKMIIDWQVEDDQGKLISCSMTLIVGPNGIEEVIDAPLMELVEQNNEVFINGKPLYKAYTSMAQSVNNQQEAGETILPTSAEEKGISRSSSNLSVNLNDSGVPTPSSYESDDFEYESDDFKNEVEVEEGDHGELEQKSKQSKINNEEIEHENKQLKEYNVELEHENKQLKKDHERLKERNERIVEEGDGYRLQLGKSEEQVKLLESELAKKGVELRKVGEENEAVVTALGDKIRKLEEDLKDRDNTIKKLGNRITQMTEEIDRINGQMKNYNVSMMKANKRKNV